MVGLATAREVLIQDRLAATLGVDGVADRVGIPEEAGEVSLLPQTLIDPGNAAVVKNLQSLSVALVLDSTLRGPVDNQFAE